MNTGEQSIEAVIELRAVAGQNGIEVAGNELFLMELIVESQVIELLVRTGEGLNSFDSQFADQ